MSRVSIPGALLLCTTTALSQARAQTPVVIPDEVSCARCSIVIRPVTKLEPGDGPGVIDRLPFAVRVDGRERYWVISEAQLPMVFDRAGRFIQLIGRKGQGPGEFQWPFDVLPVPGDSVVVFDHTAMRATVVGPDLKPGRMIRMPARLRESTLIRWPDAVVMNGSRFERSATGWALHRLSFESLEAKIDASFGSETFDLDRMEGFRMSQRVALSKPDGVWASDILRYRITWFTSSGARRKSFDRTPSWFAEPSTRHLGTPTTPPSPTVTAIHEDASGLLWVFIQTPAATWKSGWPQMKPGQREVMMKDIAYDKLFRTIVEVIDPVAGRVLTRQVMNEFVTAVLPGGRAAIYASDADGAPYVSIVALSLAGR